VIRHAVAHERDTLAPDPTTFVYTPYRAVSSASVTAPLWPVGFS
jgi:hypothetical protein